MIEAKKIEITITKEHYENLLNENQRLKEEVARLKHELSELKRLIFGSKSERFVTETKDIQQTLDLQLETQPVPAPEKETITITRTKAKRTKQSIRKALPAHLPRIQMVIEPENLPEGAKKIGEAISEQLDYIPGKLQVIQIIRPKYLLPETENRVELNIVTTENNIINTSLSEHKRNKTLSNKPENNQIVDTTNAQPTEEKTLTAEEKKKEADTQSTLETPINKINNTQKKDKTIKNQVIGCETKTQIIIAPMPSTPIPKGVASAGLLAHVFVSKFVDHIPFYRQVQMLARENIHCIAESTINGWLNQVCNLLELLYNQLKIRILQSSYVMADESPIPVLTSDKPGSTHQGYQWVYYSSTIQLVFFDYRQTRGREGPVNFFSNYTGTIQTDGYVAYDVFDKKEGIILLACMAHARRKFEHSLDNDKDRAEKALLYFQQLYEVESIARNEKMLPEQRFQLRQQKSVPVLDEFEKWLKDNQPQVLPKSAIGGAISYTLNLWERLKRYTQDGRYEIDNNLIENSIRPLALGRKNYLFAGSHEGAKRAAMMYSFFGSCKINAVNPYQWLKYVLTVISDYKVTKLDQLLPDNLKNIISKNQLSQI